MKILRKAVDFLHGIIQGPDVVPDDNNVQVRDKDADDINLIVRNHSGKARAIGRYTAFSLIGLAWTVSYQYSQFNPTGMVKLSFLCSILYLLFDYFYHIFISLAYKWLLREFFVSVNGNGYRLKDKDKDPHPYSRKFSTVGTIQILGNAVFLVASAVLLIIHILSVEI